MQHCRYSLKLGDRGVSVIPGLCVGLSASDAASASDDSAAAAALEARVKAEAGVLFNLINEASEELADSFKRRKVDQLLDAEEDPALDRGYGGYGGGGYGYGGARHGHSHGGGYSGFYGAGGGYGNDYGGYSGFSPAGGGRARYGGSAGGGGATGGGYQPRRGAGAQSQPGGARRGGGGAAAGRNAQWEEWGAEQSDEDVDDTFWW
jgi:hypothetical protein